jgi:SOS-response transcriptional repressor LexA
MNDALGSCSNSEPFALQVIGDSMEPEFPDGSIVVIEPADWCQDGMFIMALVEGVRWFRQYRKDELGEALVALNDIYPTIDLNGLDWKVEGIIMQRNLRRHQTASGRREVKHYKYG